MGKHSNRSNEVVWSLTVTFEEGTHATVHGVADSPEEAATHVAHTRAAFLPTVTVESQSKPLLESLEEIYDRRRGVITPVSLADQEKAAGIIAEKPAFLAKTPRARAAKKATAPAKKG